MFLFIFYFQPAEDVGDVFQDQGNMAAILMRKHLQSGDLLMVSSSMIIVIRHESLIERWIMKYLS